ncbi:MAG: tetratricopeptide repeat protein [Elusimicrobia bacterium]|nr:tetratricopeptide repeat protein [Elusimicrobiota bacterium]
MPKYDCSRCEQLQEVLARSCQAELEDARKAVRAAETESKVLEHEETIELILDVAGAEKYGADGQMNRPPWHGVGQALAPEIASQGPAVQAEFNKALEAARNNPKNEDAKKPTDGVTLLEGKKNPPITPVDPKTTEVVLPDGSPEGVPVRDIEDRLKEGQYEDVEQDLDRVLRNDPGNVKARSLRSSARLKQGDLEGALSDAEAVLAEDPENKEARQIKDYVELTGRVQDTSMKLKGPDFGSKDMGARFDGGGGAGEAGAGGAANRSVRSPAQEGGGGISAVDAAGTGWTAAGRGGMETVAYAPAAQRTLPLSQGLTPSQVLVNETVRMLRFGEMSGALLSATRAIQADRANARAWGARAAVSNRLKNHDAAISDATQALKLDPRNVPALLERGFAQLNMSNYSAALEDIGQALKIEPMNALAYLYRGMVFEKLARHTEALSDYETAAKLDPSLRNFWEEAKERILGKKPGNEAAKGMIAKRIGSWAVPVGLAFLLIVLGLWRRRMGSGPRPST